MIKVRILHCAGLGEGTIDEKIGDLETLANPTVGLAAHTGVVDVRIAAKAENESRAMELIAEVESAVRTRLGNAVFGADEDRLETVALEALAGRGWTVVGIEAGLGGLLGTRLPRTDCGCRPHRGRLDAGQPRCRAWRPERMSPSGLPHSAEQRTAEMVLITPRGEKSHRITYGGPPRSLSRWAVNLALNWLRTTCRKRPDVRDPDVNHMPRGRRRSGY